MNPPWILWPKAAEKLLAGHNKAICVLPAWSKPWVWDLVGAATTRIYVEAGTRLFLRKGKNCAGTQWGTWVLRVDGECRNKHTKNGVLGSVILFPRWRPPQPLAKDQGPTEADTACLEKEEQAQKKRQQPV